MLPSNHQNSPRFFWICAFSAELMDYSVTPVFLICKKKKTSFDGLFGILSQSINFPSVSYPQIYWHRSVQIVNFFIFSRASVHQKNFVLNLCWACFCTIFFTLRQFVLDLFFFPKCHSSVFIFQSKKRTNSRVTSAFSKVFKSI